MSSRMYLFMITFLVSTLLLTSLDLRRAMASPIVSKYVEEVPGQILSDNILALSRCGAVKIREPFADAVECEFGRYSRVTKVFDLSRAKKYYRELVVTVKNMARMPLHERTPLTGGYHYPPTMSYSKGTVQRSRLLRGPVGV